MALIEIPEEIEFTVYIHAYVGGWQSGKVDAGTYKLHEMEHSKTEVVLLDTQTVKLKITTQKTEDDIRKDIIATLEDHKQEIRAKAYKAEQEIQYKIDNLLQIEYAEK